MPRTRPPIRALRSSPRSPFRRTARCSLSPGFMKYCCTRLMAPALSRDWLVFPSASRACPSLPTALASRSLGAFPPAWARCRSGMSLSGPSPFPCRSVSIPSTARVGRRTGRSSRSVAPITTSARSMRPRASRCCSRGRTTTGCSTRCSAPTAVTSFLSAAT